ncbi:cerebellin 1 [Yaravirus sp. 'brasiliensis']|uniref:Cerebellin 1 n=1 Tax=Yaravirus sp. 'brasiliensis' TaxID=2739681 RepID=A0AAE7B4D9_9VIRU|nr:cerebellin 1 [Yaravirus brasiliensis]QKE44385.1 cerebellin 1 [Yaravirus brasiliensis]
MATFRNTVNAGAYYLNGVPYSGGGGGGGAGIPVPIFCVQTNTVLSSGPTNTLPAPGATGVNIYNMTGGSTTPFTDISTNITMWHGYDNSDGALDTNTTRALRYYVPRDGTYLFTFTMNATGSSFATTFNGKIGLMISVNGSVVANEMRFVVGRATRYAERGSISAEVACKAGDIVEWQLVWRDSTNGLVLYPSVITGTMLNHPPS